jgi:hypothetical protein
MSDEMPVKMMSTGVPSTLFNWHALCLLFFGEDSKATQFIKDKMDAQGPDEPVVADEGQLLAALIHIDHGEAEDART